MFFFHVYFMEKCDPFLIIFKSLSRTVKSSGVDPFVQRWDCLLPTLAELGLVIAGWGGGAGVCHILGLKWFICPKTIENQSCLDFAHKTIKQTSTRQALRFRHWSQNINKYQP